MPTEEQYERANAAKAKLLERLPERDSLTKLRLTPQQREALNAIPEEIRQEAMSALAPVEGAFLPASPELDFRVVMYERMMYEVLKQLPGYQEAFKIGFNAGQN